MPEEGVDLSGKSELLSVEEMHRLARLFAAAGVTKIRLTGGEPTLRKDLVDIVRSISSIEGIKDVGLTSNGVTLGKNLEQLQQAGLNLLNISLDTLCSDRFEAMTRRKGHSRVLNTIYKAVELGYSPVKVNVVVMRGVNDDEISDFVELTKNNPMNVRFIEYMPFDGNVWSSNKMVSYKEMMERAGAKFGGAAALERCVDASGEVAKNYRLPGHQGEISFISSMTSKFCGDCNRVRLMADGNLKVCLFGANEVSLRDALRGGASDHDLHAVVSAAVNRKKAAHAGMFELAKTKNRAMVKIGG
jgi:cyclic pyranopterin phosphate synthase